LAAIEHNVHSVRSLVGPAKKIIGVLKADAYGYGVLSVARRFRKAGVDGVALADVEQAVRIREADASLPILVYAGTEMTRDIVSALQEYRLTATIYDLESVHVLGSLVSRPLEVYLKVDVGLERIGLYPESARPVIAALAKERQLRLKGVYTHLHLPDGDPALIGRYIDWQLDRFRIIETVFHEADMTVPVRIAASSGLLAVRYDAMFDGIDPGRMLYGITVSPRASWQRELRPALVSIKSMLIEVRETQARDPEYPSPFGGAVPTRLGVMPIGLVDGMPGIGATEVLIRGRRAPLLGAPSLEYSRIDLGNHWDAVRGDEVVVVGRQGDQEIGTDEVLLKDATWKNGVALKAGPNIRRCYID
jgi:alanine racemase